MLRMKHIPRISQQSQHLISGSTVLYSFVVSPELYDYGSAQNNRHKSDKYM